MEEKLFDEWNALKQKRHFSGEFHLFNEGEIWWASVGENIGVEINGKSDRFSRPVLILKKLSGAGFMAIPLTSQAKSGSWYVKFSFRGKDSFAALSQARVMSVSRLYNRIGRADEEDVRRIKEGFRALYAG